MYFFPILILFAVINHSANTDAVNANEDEFLITFSMGGEMDMYQDGDHYGRKMTINFDGSLIIYDRVYRHRNKNSFIEDTNIYSGTVSSKSLDSLTTFMQASAFSELPSRLPAVDPREVDIREPAENIEITFQPTPDDEPHSVRAHMGADRRHYPEQFLEINRHLRSLMRARLE